MGLALQGPVSKRKRSQSSSRRRRSGTASPRWTFPTPYGRRTRTHSDCRPRPKPAPLKGERDTESRARALQDFPVGTQVGRPFEGTDGVSRVAVGEVYDAQVSYWRVGYPDGDWEELSRREMDTGVLERQTNPYKGGPSTSAASTRKRGEAEGVGVALLESEKSVHDRS